MRGIVSSLTSFGDLNVGEESAPDAMARRVNQRRQLLVMMACSYVIDALILLIYAYAGATSINTGPLYLVCSLASVAGFVVLADAKSSDRLKSRYFITQQTSVSLLLMLIFIYLAPEVGCVFLCSLFVIFALGSLRSSPWETALSWTAMAIGLGFLFLATDKPISMPHGNLAERFATMTMFVVTLGRCMFVGMFSSALRESLHSQGLRLKEAYRRIEELAELDELTGSHNRRSIMKALDDEIERAERNGTPCAVALIDLDWFKEINDRFGHPTGDEVLRTFAISIFANIRSIDKFGRYGGEEFLLILPATLDIAAHRALDRLRMIVADLDWSTIARDMRVTVSAGVVTLRPGESADSILARADVALYQAKNLGRNRIERG